MRTETEVAAMSCPVCRVPLAMSDRQGIEIDYCPQCRGVWLDRGELDKIIERSSAQVAAPPPPRSPAPPRESPVRQDYQRRADGPWGGQRESYGHSGRPKKRKSWLNELFDD